MPRSCAPLFIPRILCDRGIYSLQLLLVLAQGKVPSFNAVPLPDVSTPEDHMISVRSGDSSQPHRRKSVILSQRSSEASVEA